MLKSVLGAVAAFAFVGVTACSQQAEPAKTGDAAMSSDAMSSGASPSESMEKDKMGAEPMSSDSMGSDAMSEEKTDTPMMDSKDGK